MQLTLLLDIEVKNILVIFVGCLEEECFDLVYKKTEQKDKETEKTRLEKDL